MYLTDKKKRQIFLAQRRQPSYRGLTSKNQNNTTRLKPQKEERSAERGVTRVSEPEPQKKNSRKSWWPPPPLPCRVAPLSAGAKWKDHKSGISRKKKKIHPCHYRGISHAPLYFIKIKIHSSCEIEYFVEIHLCKLCAILRSRVLRVVCPH